jgi:Protein of unknown function (DUF3606)
MPNSPKASAPPDRARINVNRGQDVQYWTHKLGCTLPQLQHAVKMVGSRADDVAAYLKPKHA